MPNSDTAHGVYNKITKEIKYKWGPLGARSDSDLAEGTAFPTEGLSDGDYFRRTDQSDKLYRWDTSNWIEILAEDAVVAQSFGGNVETAKSAIFHADGLTNNDTNGTQLEYAITADGNGIKFTIAFGTKGNHDIAENADWADLWTTTKSSLIGADKWVKPVAEQYWDAVDATPHLF
jgi:hypothetical protein